MDPVKLPHPRGGQFSRCRVPNFSTVFDAYLSLPVYCGLQLENDQRHGHCHGLFVFRVCHRFTGISLWLLRMLHLEHHECRLLRMLHLEHHECRQILKIHNAQRQQTLLWKQGTRWTRIDAFSYLYRLPHF